MKRETTSIRLKQIMYEKNLRQVDILEMVKPYCDKYDVKMNKSDISQYVTGKVEPSQEKLVILGMALNVNEAWLMGFDVPTERLSPSTKLPKIINYYNQLNENGKSEATKRVQELTYLPQYTDVSITNEDDIALLKAIEEAPKTQEELERELFEQCIKSDAG